ncbi:MAG: hypothetical protein ACLUIR_02580 [Faecalibacterium prausnitzii]
MTREFYINVSNQIQKFGKSLAVRYLQKYCGEEAYPCPPSAIRRRHQRCWPVSSLS